MYGYASRYYPRLLLYSLQQWPKLSYVLVSVWIKNAEIIIPIYSVAVVKADYGGLLTRLP